MDANITLAKPSRLVSDIGRPQEQLTNVYFNDAKYYARRVIWSKKRNVKK